jgi:hypothetical protein
MLSLFASAFVRLRVPAGVQVLGPNLSLDTIVAKLPSLLAGVEGRGFGKVHFALSSLWSEVPLHYLALPFSQKPAFRIA